MSQAALKALDLVESVALASDDGLGGMDLEIERVRVEGELVASGLILLGTRKAA